MADWRIYDALIDGIDPGATVDALCRGAYRIVVQSGTSCGTATLLYSHRDTLPSGFPEQYLGRPLREVAALCKSWDFFSAAVGMAAINAFYNSDAVLYRAGTQQGDVFSQMVPSAAGKAVATIGHFPAADVLRQTAGSFTVFEREPRDGDLPDSAEEFLLPQMDLIFVTGMTFTNKTLPRILQLCKQAQVVLVGPSVPLADTLFSFGVDCLSGIVVSDPAQCREAIVQDSPSAFFHTVRKTILPKPNATIFSL